MVFLNYTKLLRTTDFEAHKLWNIRLGQCSLLPLHRLKASNASSFLEANHANYLIILATYLTTGFFFCLFPDLMFHKSPSIDISEQHKIR